MGGMGTAVVLGAVERNASESRRSMYFGIVTAGGSLGMFLLLPLGHFLISNLGWVAALTITGLLCLTIVPIGRLLREAPHPGDAVRPSPLRALRGAGQETRFWLLVAGFFVCGFHVSFIATHLPAYLSDQGIASSMAAWALSLIGLFNIFGSFTFGYLGSRFSKKYILCLLYLSRSIIISLFILLPVSNLSVLTFAAAMGSLDSFPGISEGVLIGGTGDSKSHTGHSDALGVHHLKHLAHAVPTFSEQVAVTVIVVSKAEHSGSARLDSHFVFERHQRHIVGFAQTSIVIY